MIAAPVGAAKRGQGLAPAQRQTVGVGLVAFFAAGSGADMVPDLTLERHGIDPTGGRSPQTEVDVLTAVDVAFVESAELPPKGAREEATGAGDGIDRGRTGEMSAASGPGNAGRTCSGFPLWLIKIPAWSTWPVWVFHWTLPTTPARAPRRRCASSIGSSHPRESTRSLFRSAREFAGGQGGPPIVGDSVA